MTAGASDEAGPLRQLAVPLGLLVLVPVAPVLGHVIHAAQPLVFVAGTVAIAVLADWMRRATEQVAEKVGSAIGGLINVSFGSLAELLLALFVLASGQAEVVRAQITGSIMAPVSWGSASPRSSAASAGRARRLNASGPGNCRACSSSSSSRCCCPPSST